MSGSQEQANLLIADWETRQSPFGFHNLAISYLDSADCLTEQIQQSSDDRKLKLSFDSPVRHLYAHAWELALKACLFAQGMRPHKLKKDIGHKLEKAWRRVDKERFSAFNLDVTTERLASHLGHFHSERLFAYPVTGIREYLPLGLIMAESQRFRLDRMTAIAMFVENTK